MSGEDVQLSVSTSQTSARCAKGEGDDEEDDDPEEKEGPALLSCVPGVDVCSVPREVSFRATPVSASAVRAAFAADAREASPKG
jgi:hypothetical protein